MAMHNTIYPGTAAKFQGRPVSPPFSNFSTSLDYPGHAQPQTPAAIANATNHHSNHHRKQQQQQQIGQLPLQQHQLQQQQQQQQQHQLPPPPLPASTAATAAASSVSLHHQHQQMQQLQHPSFSMSMHHPVKALKARTNSHNTTANATIATTTAGHHITNESNTMMNTMMGLTSGTMNMNIKDDNLDNLDRHCSDLIYPDEMDSIEFCLPPPPAPLNGHGMGHGISNELLLIHGQNGFCSNDSFNERRRRTHSRRSNNKLEVEQQVKWSRKNIAATMERFEPTQHHSSSSTSSLEYGFGANAITPSSTPSHHSQQQVSPAPSQSYQGAATASAPYNHVYSYAYYEPGVVKCHTNVPQRDDVNAILPAPTMSGATGGPPSKSPPRNSIRALLAKSFRSKSHNGQSTSSSPNTDNRHTYTTRYGTTENLYEEVNDQKIRKVLSDNRIAVTNVKDELRRVQHNHFRVLDQLNLSLEALIMPQTPPDAGPNEHEDDEENGPSTSAAAAIVATAAASNGTSISTRTSSQRPRRGGLLGGASSSSSTVSSSQQRTLSHASLENLSSTLNSIELKDHPNSSCINPEFDEGDLDSGFSGSGSSSGASYNESLRYYKTGPAASNLQHSHPHSHPHIHPHTHPHPHQNQHVQPHLLQQHHHLQHQIQNATLPHNVRSCRSSTASGTSTSKSSVTSYEDQGISNSIMTPLGPCATMVTSPNTDAITPNTSPFINYTQQCVNGSGVDGAGVGGGTVYSGAGSGSNGDVQQRSLLRSVIQSGSNLGPSLASESGTITGTKPKKNFWNIKP